MTEEFQPGDRTPSEHASERDRARQQHGGDFAGEHAPHEPARPRRRGPTREGVHFSRPFIRRPVATFLLSAAIIMAGSMAYKLLPVSSLPAVEFPTISVGASMPGADPETMASSVATPLERQFSRIAGVNEMTSSSGDGSTSITLQFDLSRDIDGAARDVQAAINAARSQLPANMPSNPRYRKINPSDSPIMILSLTSDTLTVPQLYDAADSVLAQKLATVEGVGQTFVGGSSKPAVRIEANPVQLAHYGIGLEALRAAIATINVNQPKGYLNGPERRWSITTTDQLFGADAYRPLVIATSRGPVSNASASNGLQSNVGSATSNSSLYTASRIAGATTATATGPGSTSSSPSSSTTSGATTNGSATSAATPVVGTNNATRAAPQSAQINNYGSNVDTPASPGYGIVRIGDVADVSDGIENLYTGGSVNGQPSIQIIVFKTPEANVIETVNRIEALMPQLQASIPPSIHLRTTLDRTATIRASVSDITHTMLITVILVILVVFFFLREVRSTLIPSVSLPLSLLGTFGVMYLLGYSLDNLSLMALTISTGFVVDDAIVVIENISRHLEDGLSPYEAAMVGSKEIGFTVVSMSTSLIAVFIPILLMGGIVGRLFREFAVTLSVAIMMSLLVSLTTTPMLSAKFLEPHGKRKHGRIYKWSERFFEWMLSEYERGLKWVLRRWVFMLVVTLVTIGLNIYLLVLVPKGFFPDQDTGRLIGSIQGQQDISFSAMKEKAYVLSDIVQKDPAVDNTMMFLGGGGPGGSSSNSARMYIMLKPLDQRPGRVSANDVIARLRPRMMSLPGVQAYLVTSQELRIGGRSSAAAYQYTMMDDSISELNEWVPKMISAMSKMPELRDVNTDRQERGLRTQLVIDRDRASRLGISALAIDNTLSDAFGQRQVSTTYRTLNQYHVIMEVAPQFQKDPDALKNIYIKNSAGTQVPLTTIAHFEERRVPLSVAHQGLSPATTISFNLAPGVALSQASEAIEHKRNEIGMPASVNGIFAGTAAAFQDSLKSEKYLIILALLAVYIVLGMLYESFIHPLTILSTLPSAGVGAILALLIFHVELSVIAMIGILLLIGIVKKNAIMMVDFALVAEREHGKAPKDAIYEACMLRFRPIMMTTMAALFGSMPLAFGHGVGSELRQPLGITIVGGLIVSQCLTLFTTPAVYLFFDTVFRAPKRKRLTEAAAQTYVPVAGD
ncbi:MAG: efflux RND transporter permease subunit [Acidobacteria bacterium]|nr:efflux RND transporter permease subunit [Acidobacteriota bacterium]